MDRFAKHFGQRLRRARTERGLTQSELASLAAVGANYVPRIERGEMTPSVDAAFRLAQALGVSVDGLCTPNPKSDPLQDAARVVLSLSDSEIEALRRTVQAVEVLRSLLRGQPEPPISTRDHQVRRLPRADEPPPAVPSPSPSPSPPTTAVASRRKLEGRRTAK